MTAGAFEMPHRMADPVVRRRVAAFLTALVALSWVVVQVSLRPTGAYSQGELRDIGCSVPIRPPQIERCIAPNANPIDQLDDQVQQLQQQFPGPPEGFGGGR